MTAQATAPACAIPDITKPETWLHRPLSGKDCPEIHKGKTYASLASDDAVGRMWLAKDRRNDPYAREALRLIPHTNLCECASCNMTADLDAEEREAAGEEVQNPPAESTPSVTITSAQPASVVSDKPVSFTSGPTKTVVLIDDANTPTLTTDAPVILAPVEPEPTEPKSVNPKPATPPAKPPAPAENQMEGKKIKLKKQSVAGTERAEASLEETKRALEIVAPLERLFKDAELEEDQKFVEESVERGSYIANANRRTNRDDILKRIALRLEINNGWAAAWAAKQVLLYEDILADAKRQAQAIVERAERDYELREKALMPKLTQYALSVPVEQRASEKSIRPPGWGGRLTFRWYDEDFEIVNESAAKRSIEDKLGTDECIAQGIIKVEEKLSDTVLREFLVEERKRIKILEQKEKDKSLSEAEAKELADARLKVVQGVKYVPGQDKLTLYRK